MEYITQTEEQHMQFVICGYNDAIIYHDYDKEKDKLSAGKSLTVETVKSLFNFVNNLEETKSYKFKGIIPSHILKYKTDEKYVIWQTEPGLKNILYANNLPIKSETYWVPRLIWKLNKNKLNIFACSKTIKSSQDKIYNAPFFNVSIDGSVCMGNTKFLDNNYDYEKIINKVIVGFWESKFTHSNNNELLSVNFTEWCNDIKLRDKPCNTLLVDSKKIILDIL